MPSHSCDKCKDVVTGGSAIVKGGTTFYFCKICTDILDKLPTGNTIFEFLGPEKEEKCFVKNIRLAKNLREKGESPCSKADLHCG
jgi:hypothetical protein